jgi:alpha-glucosidase
MDHPDGKHNYVNTREELKERDPGLYEVLARYFPATDQQISKHKFVNECTKENSRTR